MAWTEYLLAVGLLAFASCQMTFRLDSRFVTDWSVDRKLVNFSLSTHSVRNVHQCIALCSEGCRSVNFSPGNPGECQLNSQAASQSSGFLVSHVGTIYASVATQGRCNCRGCSSREVCIPTNGGASHVHIRTGPDCGPPPLVANASLDDARSSTSDVTYVCNTGFRQHAGNDTITCRLGSWSQPSLVCEAVDCGPRPPVANANLLFNGTGYNDVTIVQCKEGFADPTSSTATSVCHHDNEWSAVSIDCQIVDCGDFPDVANAAHVSRGTSYGDVTNVTCDVGFFSLVGGVASSVCQADGAWSDVTIICQVVNCGDPPYVTNAHVTDEPSTTYASNATYQCSLGYVDKGGNSVTSCLINGSWSDVSLSCAGCDPPAVLANADANYTSNAVGDTGTYVCHEQFIFIPLGTTPSIVCQSDLEWSIVSYSIYCTQNQWLNQVSPFEVPIPNLITASGMRIELIGVHFAPTRLRVMTLTLADRYVYILDFRTYVDAGYLFVNKTIQSSEWPDGSWIPEIGPLVPGYYPVVIGAQYNLTVLVDTVGYVVYFNDELYAEFSHQRPYMQTYKITVDGDTTIESLTLYPTA